MATSAASVRVFSMDGHAMNSKRAKKEALKDDQRFYIFTLHCFLRSSVGFGMNH